MWQHIGTKMVVGGILVMFTYTSVLEGVHIPHLEVSTYNLQTTTVETPIVASGTLL